MKRRDLQQINHLITAGNKNFPFVTSKGLFNTIRVFYKNLDTDDVTISVEQSTGTSDFDIITGVTKQLDKTQKSHTFNIIDLNTDLIRLVLDTGTGSQGEIERFEFLFE